MSSMIDVLIDIIKVVFCGGSAQQEEHPLTHPSPQQANPPQQQQHRKTPQTTGFLRPESRQPTTLCFSPWLGAQRRPNGKMFRYGSPSTRTWWWETRQKALWRSPSSSKRDGAVKPWSFSVDFPRYACFPVGGWSFTITQKTTWWHQPIHVRNVDWPTVDRILNRMKSICTDSTSRKRLNIPIKLSRKPKREATPRSTL